MKRDVSRLSGEVHDLLIIGGGIYGATAARAAALQGLNVALIEQSDFGEATSANSLKVIHGGLRYLQQMNFKRMRASIDARRRLLHLAPHLVHPQPFVIPTYGHGLHGKLALASAFIMNDMVSWDRNRSLPPSQRIPAGRLLSRESCLDIMPDISPEGLTGGALWFDAVVRNSERLTLSFVLSANEHGACVANYVEANRYLLDNNSVVGIAATDHRTGADLEIRSRVVLNATGPWIDGLANTIPGLRERSPPRAWAKAVNLVVNRPLFHDYAVGLRGGQQPISKQTLHKKSERFYFFVPWRGGTLVGTSYDAFIGPPNACGMSSDDISEIVDEVNNVYPPAQLSRDDISFVHSGLLPAVATNPKTAEQLRLVDEPQILDYEQSINLRGLISALGVKYTTAVSVADKVVNVVMNKLRLKCKSQSLEPALQLSCDGTPDHASTSKKTISNSCLDVRTIEHLKEQYGNQYEIVLDYVRRDPTYAKPISSQHPTIAAEVIHGIRGEMACTLTDIVLRRTELGTFGYPGEHALRQCARLLAQELGWASWRTRREIQEVEQIYHVTRQVNPVSFKVSS